MKTIAIFAILLLAQLAIPQSNNRVTKLGKWLDTTKDTKTRETFYINGGDGDLLLTEDYEVVRTHEVCASVYGYFLKQSQLGRYNVQFHGMRTSASFEFTTQYDAEKWAEKWCTPQSLWGITAGRGTFARNY